MYHGADGFAIGGNGGSSDQGGGSRSVIAATGVAVSGQAGNTYGAGASGRADGNQGVSGGGGGGGCAKKHITSGLGATETVTVGSGGSAGSGGSGVAGAAGVVIVESYS